MTGQSKSSVHKHLEALEQGGYIRREARFRDNGSQTTDGIYLLAPPEALDPNRGYRGIESTPQGVQTLQAGGTGLIGGRGIEPTPPEPSLNPLEEPLQESSGETAEKQPKHPGKPTTREKEKTQEEVLRNALGKVLFEQLLAEEDWRRLWLELPLEAIAGAIATAKRGYKNRFGTRLKDALDALIPVERRVSEVARRRERETAARREQLRREAQAEADAAPITDFAAMSDAEFERYNRRFKGALADANRRTRAQQQRQAVQDRPLSGMNDEARTQEQSAAARRYALVEQARQLGA